MYHLFLAYTTCTYFGMIYHHPLSQKPALYYRRR